PTRRPGRAGRHPRAGPRTPDVTPARLTPLDHSPAAAWAMDPAPSPSAGMSWSVTQAAGGGGGKATAGKIAREIRGLAREGPGVWPRPHPPREDLRCAPV